jgi:hypothetical protein
MVGCADRHGIDMLRLLVQHLAKVFVPPRLGKCPKRTGGTLFIDVAQGHDVRAQSGHGGDVAPTHAPDADSRHIDAFARCEEADPSQHVAGTDGECQGRSPRQESSTRTHYESKRSIKGVRNLKRL